MTGGSAVAPEAPAGSGSAGPVREGIVEPESSFPLTLQQQPPLQSQPTRMDSEETLLLSELDGTELASPAVPTTTAAAVSVSETAEHPRVPVSTFADPNVAKATAVAPETTEPARVPVSTFADPNVAKAKAVAPETTEPARVPVSTFANPNVPKAAVAPVSVPETEPARVPVSTFADPNVPKAAVAPVTAEPTRVPVSTFADPNVPKAAVVAVSVPETAEPTRVLKVAPPKTPSVLCHAASFEDNSLAARVCKAHPISRFS